VSLSELEGESDLVIAWGTPDSMDIALVENKIGADFQPDQGTRYQARARKWERNPAVRKVSTVLIAPQDYFDRSGSESFDHKLSYEEIADHASKAGDGRSEFFAAILLAGIDSYRRGYVAEPNEQVSSIWNAIWERSAVVAPKLNMKRPHPKPGQSVWPYFRDAEGLAQQNCRKVVLVLKAERGHADLQFGSTSVADLRRRTSGILQSDMTIEPASKSASVRIRVPSVDFRTGASSQEASIDTALGACDRLRVFFATNAERLLI
jgi:hypothetical protein